MGAREVAPELAGFCAALRGGGNAAAGASGGADPCASCPRPRLVPSGAAAMPLYMPLYSIQRCSLYTIQRYTLPLCENLLRERAAAAAARVLAEGGEARLKLASPHEVTCVRIID